MKAIHGIWKNGQIVPTQPIDLPDGTALSIEPIDASDLDAPDGDLEGDDSASIARRIAFYEALPPLKMSASEEAEWRVARQEMRDYTIARMKERQIESQP